mmetsp:Transcript_55573/g.146613  ORF Transcript_55573/g.146613 Transcript_55573/m.146613 type:complete len:202 (+) Transcript_55573:1042-1647(+)
MQKRWWRILEVDLVSCFCDSAFLAFFTDCSAFFSSSMLHLSTSWPPTLTVRLTTLRLAPAIFSHSCAMLRCSSLGVLAGAPLDGAVDDTALTSSSSAALPSASSAPWSLPSPPPSPRPLSCKRSRCISSCSSLCSSTARASMSSKPISRSRFTSAPSSSPLSDRIPYSIILTISRIERPLGPATSASEESPRPSCMTIAFM